MQNGCLIVGIGNPDRGDDAVGRFVARRLSAQCAPDVQVIEHGGEAAGLIECLNGSETVYLIDACSTGECAGKIRRFDVSEMELPRAALGCSTHGLGLAEALELARALGKLPRRCVIYAVEGRTYDAGAALSPEVARAAEEVAILIRDELADQQVE